MSFDISTLDASIERQEQGVPVDLLHPGNGKLIVTLTVASYESERVMARARAIGNEVRRRRAKNPHKVDTVEADEDRMRHLAAAAVTSWGGLEMEGKPVNDSNAVELLEKYRFIHDAIQEAGGDRARFFSD